MLMLFMNNIYVIFYDLRSVCKQDCVNTGEACVKINCLRFTFELNKINIFVM